MRYVAYRDKKRVAADLKPVYRAINVEAAEHALAAFEERQVMAPLPATAPDVDRRWVLRVPPGDCPGFCV